MTMFVYKGVAFDSTATYNLMPLPPQGEDERFGLKISSNSFADKSALLLFEDEGIRDEAFVEFLGLINQHRKTA